MLKIEVDVLEKEIIDLLYQILNVLNELVKVGKNEEDNEIVEEVGEFVQLYEGVFLYWELIKKFNLIDFELGVKIIGVGFFVYCGKGVKF